MDIKMTDDPMEIRMTETMEMMMTIIVGMIMTVLMMVAMKTLEIVIIPLWTVNSVVLIIVSLNLVKTFKSIMMITIIVL
jgi:hypothetical protein